MIQKGRHRGKHISGGSASDCRSRPFRTTDESNASAVDVHGLFVFARLLSVPARKIRRLERTFYISAAPNFPTLNKA